MMSDSGAKIYAFPSSSGNIGDARTRPLDRKDRIRAKRERRVLEVIRARSARNRILDAGLLCDPVWDMLLALYAAGLGRRPLTAKRLCLASPIPTHVALRYIAILEREGLVVPVIENECGPDYMCLSDKGFGAMESYFDYLNADEFPDVIAPGKLGKS